MNYSNDAEKQKQLYKKAVDVVIGKVNDITFKADVIEFLTSQFSVLKNVDLVDYLFANHFDKLPKDKQNLEFKKRIEEAMAIAIGRIAPDFSWTENGKEISLSQLKGGQSYLIIFYSTECGHCLREIPQIYDFMKDKTKTKVIAFAMETSDVAWKNYIKNLSGWHHSLGLGKWENPIGDLYGVTATPTYFILDKDKKIIAKPHDIKEVKEYLDQKEKE